MSADVGAILRDWDHDQQLRAAREGEFQQIAEYFMPRKNFSVGARPTELLRRRVTSSAGPRVLARGSAFLVGFLLDQTRPFIGPNVEGALIRAGKSVNLDPEETDFLDTVEWRLHGMMMRPASNYLASTSRVAVELMGFGNGVRWTGRTRGFGPKYQHRPFRSCWFTVNDEGDVDGLKFRFTLPAWKACQKWPELAKCDSIARKAGDPKTCQEEITLLHVVDQRRGGKAGAVATNKPYKEVLLAVDEKFVAHESGYDSFPYSVARLNVEEGSPYGTGVAWQALPNIMVINKLQQMTELGISLSVLPPTMEPARLFPRQLDRRPGARNTFDPRNLGLMNLQEAVQKLDLTGNPLLAVQYIQNLMQEVDQIFFIDWMNLSDGVQKTATEVLDRRDIHLRAMTALVPALDRDLMGKDADRSLEICFEEGMLPDPPARLDGAEVEWDYKGPLARMQQRGQLEAAHQIFDLAIKGAQIDEAAPKVLMVDECIRNAAEAVGLTMASMRSRTAMIEAAETMAEQSQDQQDVQLAMGAGQAARDFGQAVATVEDGNGGGRPRAAA